MLVNIVSTNDDLDLKFIKHLQYINIIDHYQLHQKAKLPLWNLVQSPAGLICELDIYISKK